MKSWKDIIGGPVSFSQKVTDAWNSIIGGSSGDREDESSDSDSGGIKWPPNPCVEPAWSQDATGVIEVRVYWSWNRKAVAEKLAEHARYALGEAFGETHRPKVTVADEPVPQHIRDLNDFIPWYENNADHIAADCNILVTETGDATGGGNSAICGRISKGDALVDDCIRERGSDEKDELVNEFLHEVGHCLGFDHDSGLRLTEYGKTFVPPMPGSYAGGGQWIHRYHPKSIKNAESPAFDDVEP